MNSEVDKKLDELVDTINNNEKINRMKELKKMICSDENLKKDLETYRNLDEYSNDSIKLKEKIIENPLVKEYRLLENELYFTVLDMNKLLNSLIGKGSCSK